MCPLWVRRANGGECVHLNSAADAVTHLKTNGTDIFHTHVTRAAKKGGTAKGWEFSFDDSRPEPLPSPAASALRNSPALMSSFFSPTSALPTCACCGDKLHGDITTCTNCMRKVHALCTQGGVCAMNLQGGTCGHARHACTECIPHMQCTWPLMWKWCARHAPRGPKWQCGVVVNIVNCRHIDRRFEPGL